MKSEEQVFEAVHRWVTYPCDDTDIGGMERQVACPRLLNHVRLPQLSPEYIMAKVGSDVLFSCTTSSRSSLIKGSFMILDLRVGTAEWGGNGVHWRRANITI